MTVVYRSLTLVLFVLFAAGCGAPATPSVAPPSAAEPAPSTSSAQPDSEWCHVQQDDGSFYLYVTSGTAHRFDDCTGATVLPEGQVTIDSVLSQVGWDRRCVSSDAAVAQSEALTAVYSGPGKDLAAAKAWCAARAWTNN